jgi:type IV secretory pathway VirB10-like protein
MIDRLMKFGCASLGFALLGCGSNAPEPAGANAGEDAISGGLTIVLPEPRVAAASPAAAKQAEPFEEPPPPPAAEPAASPDQAPANEAAPAPDEIDNPEATEPVREPSSAAQSSRPPLPDTVIARTIDRIGFPCGAVASSAAVTSSGGERAYRITCTSGRSYRASNRTGRFRFREWSETE